MKTTVILAVLLATSCAAFADEPWEGAYSNGAITITRSVGDRGGDEFESSKCAGKLFRPRLDPKTDVLVGEGKAYTISTDAKYTRLTVQGANSCMPKGDYKKS
ncbi:hypothetical protein ACSFBI_01480 [Variovorax sp. RB3P1]|uniref:hypothetical protein n=1 Tax=Variovorax sp. RB3P1 TaxID=3443732 RepID=UPI003F455CCF